MTHNRRVYTILDVTRHDALILQSAAGHPDKSWYCYGVAWYKLDQLELVDEDLRPTPLGLSVARKILEGSDGIRLKPSR